MWNWILNSKKTNYSQFWENFILSRKLRLHLCLILRRATPPLPSKNPKLNQKSMEDGNSGSFNPSPLHVEFKAFFEKKIFGVLSISYNGIAVDWWAWPANVVVTFLAASSSHRMYQKGLCSDELISGSKALGHTSPTFVCGSAMWDVKPELKFVQRWKVKLFPPPQPLRSESVTF